ncbi:MAG: GNAT family N-acetyltransferase [Terriglobia bacterium]
MRLIFETLGKNHDREAFSCGIEALDRYLKTQALQNAKKYVAAVFVLVNEGEPDRILGYYTLSATSVKLSELPPETAKKIPKYPSMPATLLGRFAVSDQCREMGFGELLLMDALKRSFDQSVQIGSSAVIVDAKDEKASAFYQHFGFRQFLDNPRKLFLPMRTIERLFTAKDALSDDSNSR